MIGPRRLLQIRMTQNGSFMERWGHKEGGGARDRQTRSATKSSQNPQLQDTRPARSPISSPLKRKRDTETAASTPQKSRKPTSSPKPTSEPAKSASEASPAQILSRLLAQKVSSKSGPKITDYGTSSAAATSNNSANSESATPSHSPFEELLGAVVVARPISHKLGHRAIATLLSPPYNLRTPRAILDAGEKRVFEALEEAKTLHKDKTASQLVALAHTVINKFDFPTKEEKGNSVELEKLRRDAQKNGKRLKEILIKEVKGVGETASDIFLRRIQRLWGEFWPVIDTRTASALQVLGLPGEAEKLRALVDECWSQLDIKVDQGKDEEEQKRQTFVEVLKEAVDADLKGKIDNSHARPAKSKK